MIHAKGGWYFGRVEDGGVHIESPNDEVRLDADTWASVIASVSARGDVAEVFLGSKAEVFQEAKRFHSLEKQEIKTSGVEEVRRFFNIS